MRTLRTFRPLVENMPSRDLPSNLLFPSNPLTPVKIPSTPPPTYVDPTDPYHINTQVIYDEPIVGPPGETSPPPGTEGEMLS